MASQEPGRIRVGTSGWDHESWVGLVYPGGRSIDRLQATARFVDLLEIDGQRAPLPGPVAMERLARWGHWAGLRFVVVAPRALVEGRARDAAAMANRVKGSVAPLLGAGVLAAVVLQLPQRLHHTPDGARHLAAAIAALSPCPCAVEPRHASWDLDDVRRWLADHGVAWCNLDQPELPGALPPTAHWTAPPALVRLHGRDRDRWFARLDDEDERHAWRYSADALEPWARRVRALARRGGETLVLATNYGRAEAIATAAKLRALLEPGSARAPAPLLDRDAELAALGVRPLPLVDEEP